jgi:hypothetical protein
VEMHRCFVCFVWREEEEKHQCEQKCPRVPCGRKRQRGKAECGEGDRRRGNKEDTHRWKDP